MSENKTCMLLFPLFLLFSFVFELALDGAEKISI